MRAPILYFLLWILGISLNLGPDIGYKQGGFCKTLLEKSLEFVLNKSGCFVALNLGLVLLPAEVDLIPEKRGYEGNKLGAHGTSTVKKILALLTKVVILYIRAPIIQVEISGL